jgi:hypothetical protein
MGEVCSSEDEAEGGGQKIHVLLPMLSSGESAEPSGNQGVISSKTRAQSCQLHAEQQKEKGLVDNTVFF